MGLRYIQSGEKKKVENFVMDFHPTRLVYLEYPCFDKDVSVVFLMIFSSLNELDHS